MKKPLACILLLLISALCLSGCASTSREQELMKAEIERQAKMESRWLPPDEEKQNKNLPPMTAAQYERKGDFYAAHGERDEALVCYREALAHEPGRPGALYKAGAMELQKGMFAAAACEFKKALENNSDAARKFHPASLEGMGVICLARGQLDKAKGFLIAAGKLDPSMWGAMDLLGIIYDRQKRYSRARGEFEAAIGLNPSSGALFNNLGMSYLLAGDYEKARKAFAEALKLEKGRPGEKRVYGNMGLAFAKAGRYRRAFAMFEKAGARARALNNLGYVSMMGGKYAMAISAFRKAMQADPAWYGLAHQNLKRALRLSSREQVEGGQK